MSSSGHREHMLDRLALRATGRRPPQPAPPVESKAEHDDGETMSRSQALRRFGAAVALSLLPLRLMESSAEAKRDCFNPCLGLIKAAMERSLGKCTPHIGDYLLGFGLGTSLWCAIENTGQMQNGRLECYQPDCGKYGDVIKRGGHIDNFPVVPLELPAGTHEECENCESVGGYCGVCPEGSPGFEKGKSMFFCGTPPVLPCRYCGGQC
jgi:hypothetical protein